MTPTPAKHPGDSRTWLSDPADTVSLRAQLVEVSALLAALSEPPGQPALVFRRPDSPVVECVPIGAGLVVGRAEECAVRFPEREDLSRRHFEVRAHDGWFTLRDLGSSNGTTVEGVNGPVQQRELRDGDLIRAGRLVFLFVRA